jgi:SAM-dependent methyltransferase
VVRPSAGGRRAVVRVVADAYAQGAGAWSDGPARVYGPLAELLVAFSPEPLAGRLVLDSGSGTGVGSRAALAAGALVVALDLVPDMLLVDRSKRPPGVAGDLRSFPFRDRAFDAVLSPFSLNHLDDPVVGVREAGRVGRLVIASTYSVDDDHPAKQAVETALAEAGWTRPEWYAALKLSMAAWGTVAGATAVLEAGGLDALRVETLAVPLPELGPADMVEWRLGLAHCAAFFANLAPAERARVCTRALELLGPNPAPVVRRVIFFAGRTRSS